MRNQAFLATGLLTIMLAACGGSVEQEVVEQIVVREPGDAPAAAATMPTEGTVDLVAMGEQAFAACSSCHAIDADAPSGAGPNLHGVFGQAAGAREDFAYSDALAASGLTWDEASLDRYLADPSGTVPDTYMSAGAVPDDDRRAAIIAYLKTLSE